MAGGRGAHGRGREEPPESYPQRQDHELQALEAIYGSDFQDLRPDACGRVGTWLVWSRLACCGPAPLARSTPARPARLCRERTAYPSLGFWSPFIPRDSTHAHFLSLRTQPLGGSPEPPTGTNSLTAFPPRRLQSYLALFLIPTEVP